MAGTKGLEPAADRCQFVVTHGNQAAWIAPYPSDPGFLSIKIVLHDRSLLLEASQHCCVGAELCICATRSKEDLIIDFPLALRTYPRFDVPSRPNIPLDLAADISTISRHVAPLHVDAIAADVLKGNVANRP